MAKVVQAERSTK